MSLAKNRMRIGQAPRPIAAMLVATMAMLLTAAPAYSQNSSDRRFDEYTWLTTHNSYANYEDARWSHVMQSHSIVRQLDNGVRGLMLDAHWFGGSGDALCAISLGTDCYGPGVYMCHGSCSGAAGFNYALPRRTLTDTLNEIGQWLQDNPTEIVTIFLEDRTTNGQLIAPITLAERALPLIFDPESDDWYVQARGWPPLQWMREKNKRLVIFTSEGKNESFLTRARNDYAVENTFDLGAIGQNIDCKSRNKVPLDKTEPNWNRLFIMNHFRRTPTPAGSTIDNQFNKLNSRVFDKCLSAAGKLPNYVAVDYYELGDAKLVVDHMNRTRQLP